MKRAVGRWSLFSFLIVCIGCGAQPAQPPVTAQSVQLRFGPEVAIGRSEANPSTPFLRYAPDGRLFAIWTEDHDKPWPNGPPGRPSTTKGGDRAASPLRNAMGAAISVDGGKTWSPPRRVNSAVEAVQGEENGPKIALGADKRAYIVWSIPGGERRQDPRQYSLRHG